MQKAIKVAIAGVGNCASSLVQGVEYYRNRQGVALEGIMRHSIGGYSCSDVEFVAAFDIDRRKVGHPLEEAIFAKPNCTRIFQSALPVSNVIVQAGPVLDGVARAHGRLSRRCRLPCRRSRADRCRRGATRVGCRGSGVLPAGRLGAGGKTLRPGLSGCPCRHDQLRSRVPCLGPRLGAEISGRRRPDRRRRYQEPGRGDHRTPGVGAAVRRPRGWPRSDLSTQHWRQYRLPQHA